MTIPVSWPVRPLSQVVDVLDSRRVPVKASDRAARSGSVPYYGATGQAGWIDEPLFNEPLVLLGEDGAPFLDPYKPKAYLIDGPAWVNNHAHVLRARTGLDRRFLRYYLDYFDYRGFANGTTRLKLTQAAMRGIPVPTPPVEVQSCLVDIIEDHLSRLDAANSCLDQAMVRIQSLNEQIIRRLDRGSTLIHAQTGYCRTELPMILSVVSNRELPRLTRLVSEIDPAAFVVVSAVKEVRGRGFSLNKEYR